MKGQNIQQKTLDKYSKFLKTVMNNAGHDFNLPKAASFFGVHRSAISCAKNIGLFDYEKGRIKKVFYSHVEPITARRLVEAVNIYVRAGDRKQKSVKPKSLPDNSFTGKKAEEPRVEPKATPSKVKAVVLKEEAEPTISKVKASKKTKGFQVRLFGIPIIEFRR